MSQPVESMPAASAGRGNSSVAIARTATALAYEKPERARTSHACEPCRERKTKCDGERPSCRRCLHTGNPCHYGFGKGWRKRKTQEDLSTTSQRLQRYEELLNEILPLVNPEVQGLIAQARREQEHMGGSDSTESEVGSHPPPAAFGQANANVFQQGNQRLPPLPEPYDHVRSTGSAPGGAVLHRLSSGEQGAERLPSITSTGMLIERDRLAQLQHAMSQSPTALRPSISPTRPDHQAGSDYQE